MASEAQPLRAPAAAQAPALRRARLWELAAEHPALIWLTGLVGLSAAMRFALAYWIPVPWIFADELKYSELAKSFAVNGSFAVRGVHGLGLGPLYPVLISPAYALFENVPHAYLMIKATNSILVSLAAVPAYFLARRVVGRAWALVAAALTLATPSLVYTGMVMTENLFFPLFLTTVWATVAALERPTARRQLMAVALIALGLLTRSQAIALVPALLTSIALVSIGDAAAARSRLQPKALWRSLARFWPTFLALGGGAAAVILREVARGRSVFASFGDAEGVWRQSYSVGAVARWFLYHVAELDLYAGVLPFAAFLILASFTFASEDRRLRVLAAVFVSVAFWLLLTASTFLSGVARFDVTTLAHISDRYTFYVVPLMLIALVAWLARRLPGSVPLTAAAVVIAGALPLAVPYKTFIRNDAIPDTFGLLPWADIRGPLLVAPSDILLRIGVMTLVLGALFYLLRPPRWNRLVLALVLLNFLVVMSAAEIRTHGSSAAAADLIQSDRGWVDKAIGPNADAVVIWSGLPDPHVVWENEFFNRSVGAVYYLHVPSWAGLPEEKLSVSRRTGALVDASGVPLHARYVLADPWVVLRGRIVARDRTSGMRLYRLDGPNVRISAL